MKVIRLKESDIKGIVKRVLNEQEIRTRSGDPWEYQVQNGKWHTRKKDTTGKWIDISGEKYKKSTDLLNKEFDDLSNKKSGEETINQHNNQGKKQGLWKKYYNDNPNGQIKTEGNYKDGELEGTYKEWYENGQLRFEGNFKYGKRNGLQRWWFENGKLKQESTEQHGKWITRQCWDENGNRCEACGGGSPGCRKEKTDKEISLKEQYVQRIVKKVIGE